MDELRTCRRCAQTKPIADFPERKLGTGRRHTHCRACKADYQKAWYEANKQRHKANVAAIRRARVALHQHLVRSAKDVPCADCGRCFPPYVMDLDHRPGVVKVDSVAQMVSTATTAALRAEIAKCDVVCANCHRERTYGDERSAWHRRPKPWEASRDEPEDGAG